MPSERHVRLDTASLVAEYEEELLVHLAQTRRQSIDRETIAARLKAEVIGFDVTIDDLVSHVASRISAPTRRPTAVFIAGPSGSGKTSIAQALARVLERPFVHVDCTQLQDSTAMSKVFGMAAGYVGAEQGGLLSNALTQNQRAVVCVDELTDAYAGLRQSFLTLLERGEFTRPVDHAVVDCSQTIFVFASNAGAGRIALPRVTSHAEIMEQQRVIRAAILAERGNGGWTPQFLNRFQRLYWFGTPLLQHLPRIVAKIVVDMLESYDWGVRLVRLEQDAMRILTRGMDQAMLDSEGARGVVNRLETALSEPLLLAQQWIEYRADREGLGVGLVARDGELTFIEEAH